MTLLPPVALHWSCSPNFFTCPLPPYFAHFGKPWSESFKIVKCQSKFAKFCVQTLCKCHNYTRQNKTILNLSEISHNFFKLELCR